MQDSGQLQLFNGPLGSAFYKIADVYHNLVEKNEQTEQENKNLRELASFTLFAKTVTLEITLIKKDPLRSNPMGAINVSQEVTMRIWLRQMRAQKGVSQASAARELQVARQTLAAWEAGRKSPDRENVFRLADLLGPEVLTHFEAEVRAKGGVA